MRIGLRTKMMVFAAAIAILPLLTSGQSIIRVAQDELKSGVNEQIAATAKQITDHFNLFFDFSLLTPLDLISNSVGSPELGSQEKLFILRQGIADLPDIVSLQVDVEGLPNPILVTQEAYSNKLAEFFDKPPDVLRVNEDFNDVISQRNANRIRSVAHIEETGDWLGLVSLVIPNGIGGRRALLHARIDLGKLKDVIDNHPFIRIGQVHVVGGDGQIVFGSNGADYDHKPVLAYAQQMIASRTATIAVSPFALENGTVTLAALVAPRAFPWVIIVEKSERDAYQPIADMVQSLLRWLAIGVAAALVGAVVFATRLSKPILRIGEAALEIAKGNLDVAVPVDRGNDEISDLAKRFNTMIGQLKERFELQKFVSRETVSAIQKAGSYEVSLGGERRRVAILFADIRGYTAFSESREPEEVVAVLNSYFQEVASLVSDNHGDIDKFVGDEVMAVFYGRNDAKHAVQCGIAIMDAMESMAAKSGVNLRIGIGINVGDVVVGAMGSSDRKDFTVLGDHVNLAARLCSHAEPDEILVSKNCMDLLPAKLTTISRKLPSIRVKGKTTKIKVFGFYKTH